MPKYEDEGAYCRGLKVLKETGKEQFSQKLLGIPESIIDTSKQNFFSSFSPLITLKVDAKEDSVWCILHGIET